MYPQNSQYRILSAFKLTDDFKIPDRSKEVEICIDAYLEKEFLNLLSDGINSKNDIISAHGKVVRVYQSLKNSKKVNISSLSFELPINDEFEKFQEVCFSFKYFIEL